MFDLQLLNKVNEVEKQTGQSLLVYYLKFHWEMY